jgi:uncharacterized protein
MPVKTSFWARACAVIAAAGALVLGGAARAEPAIWVVKDADSTIYLFGSVHMLKADLEWKSPKVTEALKSATELWLEIPNVSNQEKAVAEMLPLMVQKGMAPDKPLSGRLSAEEFTQLQDMGKTIGLPPEALNVMRPWLAAMIISTAPLNKAGYLPGAGVEAILETQAKAEGDQLRGFETIAQQISFFADLPYEVELAYLKTVLSESGETVAELDRTTAAWAKGDVGALEKDVIGEMSNKSPEVYQAILVRRNQDWAEQLAERLKGSGVTFVAVGAAHLAGPDSVQAQLKKKGFEATRF